LSTTLLLPPDRRRISHLKRSDWWRLKRLGSASVPSVANFPSRVFGGGQHTLLDDRNVLLSGNHLFSCQLVCRQQLDAVRTLSAVGVSCRDDFDLRASNSSRRGALGTLVSEAPLAPAVQRATPNRIRPHRSDRYASRHHGEIIHKEMQNTLLVFHVQLFYHATGCSRLPQVFQTC
jgi:hypothetical protein